MPRLVGALIAIVAALSIALQVSATAAPGFALKWGYYGSSTGQFSSPNGISSNGADFIYVADTFNARIQVLHRDGTFIRSIGSAGTSAGQFQAPFGVATDSVGNIYVADTYNNRVQVFSSAGAFLQT